MLGGNGPTPVSKAELHADLVEQIAQDQDKSAFAQLFEYFAPRLKSYLIQSGCDESLAEEVTQDTLISLWRKARLFDRNKSSVSTWLFRIARNRRIDILRRDKTATLNADDPTLFPKTIEIDETAPDAIERNRQVKLALDALSPAQRDIIKMSFFETKPHSVIAEEMSLPLGTVKSRIRLAFGKLREALSDNEKIDID